MTSWLLRWKAATSPGVGMSSWPALHTTQVCMLQLAIHLSTLCMGMRPVDILCGTPQQDILCGTPQQDILCGTPQQDILCGTPQQDILCGTPQQDILCGTPQQDILCGTPQQDILCGTPQQDNISHSEYVAKVQKGLGDVFDKVWEKTGQSQVRQKAYYDRKVHDERFNTGDLVWL